MKKSRVKLLRLALGCIVLLAMFFGPSTDTSIVADIACQWTGYLLLVVGLGFRLWSILYVGQRKSHELIMTGPYSLCRNPLYVGTVLLTLGTALSFENLAMCLFALVVVIPIHVAVVLSEERHLEAIFGEEYIRYCRRTPRFFFRIASYNSLPRVDISVKALRRAANRRPGRADDPGFGESGRQLAGPRSLARCLEMAVRRPDGTGNGKQTLQDHSEKVAWPPGIGIYRLAMKTTRTAWVMSGLLDAARLRRSEALGELRPLAKVYDRSRSRRCLGVAKHGC